MKYFNFITMTEGVKKRLTEYLKNQKFKFEVYTCYHGWHFEIFCYETQLKQINNFLNKIDFYG